jgi:hypothetical protein
VLAISRPETQRRSDSTERLIKEWLWRFGANYKEDVAPLLPVWLEVFDGINPETLESLFRRALKTCKFFPKVSEILEPIQKAEETAIPEAAEQAWQRVLEIRRLHWNPDTPGPFRQALAKLSDRERQAARAAGVFQDFESVEALHTWAKKNFIESFVRYGELERDGFLLADGETKRLLTDFVEAKALPAPSVDWADLRERGEAYRKKMASDPSPQPPELTIRRYKFTPPTRSLDEQKRILREKGFLPEQQPVEASA